MKNREGHNEDTKFFIGYEVEMTPAYGEKTLFVVGLQNPKEILARALNENCPHIYLGANQSFNPETADDWANWDFVVTSLVDNDVWVTLDFDIKYAEGVCESSYGSYDTFIPIVSAKMPYIQQLGYNAVLKLDDKGFKESNPGVWCHSIHKLTERSAFTSWSKYTKDKIIE